MEEHRPRNAIALLARKARRSASAGATPQPSTTGHVLPPRDCSGDVAAKNECQVIPFQAIDDTIERLFVTAERVAKA
ncbi:hypothetical protein AADZ90_019665 [Aestuariibius sp. 2305UL40-4]|uniref:hypothetical protein n=1 Tax=Aestuariibius violaceus TaxID=3234132 RepID=UPI00345E43BB